jgi:tetratricopeptide (TPR) repeat protein
MLTEYLYSSKFSYREYLARVNLSTPINIHISREIREAVGSTTEIYGEIRGDAAHAPIVELCGESSYAGYVLEIVSADLSGVWEFLDIPHANLVNAFQSAFLARDEEDPAVSHLLPRGGSDGEPPLEMAAQLVRKRMFPEALSALEQSAPRGADVDIDRLVGTIRSGISGIPESIPTLDLVEAERRFLRASEGASPPLASQCLIAAARAAYVQGRFADAETHLKGAIAAAPTAAEAYYQMARLRLHAGDVASVESLLEKAFSLHWSFALRAASDTPFVINPGHVVSVAQAVSNRIMHEEVAPALQRLNSQLQLLAECELERHPVRTQKSYVQLSASAGSLGDNIRSGRLKVAHRCRAQILSLEAAFVDVCNEYSRSLITMWAQPTADGSDADTIADAPAVHHRPGMLTAAFGLIALLFIAAYLGPQLTAAVRRPEFDTLEFLRWLSKVLFVWFVFTLFAVPAFWLVLRTAIRRRLGQELDNPPPAHSNAEWLNAEVNEVVLRVEEMANAYKKGPVDAVADDDAKRSEPVETGRHEPDHHVVPLARP